MLVFAETPDRPQPLVGLEHQGALFADWGAAEHAAAMDEWADEEVDEEADEEEAGDEVAALTRSACRVASGSK